MTMHHARIAQIEDRPSRRIGRLRERAEALPSLAEAGRSLASALLVVANTFERRRKMRRDLLSLDASQLKDVGLTRDEALRAAERIEWRGDWS